MKPVTKPQIIVVKLGWVIVGNVQPADADGVFRVTECHNIRVWGTTRGLGQLAFEGPTSDTKLDKMGSCVVERSSTLFRIDCEDAPWKKILR